MTIENGNMLVSGVTVKVSYVLEDSVLEYIVDNSDEIVEDVDGVKNVVVVTIENRSMQVSGVSVMICSVLEDSVFEFIVDNSDEVVDVDGV